MTDLVDKLRDFAEVDVPDWLLGMADAAADEIERLRAEINSLVSAQNGWGRVPKLETEIKALRALCNDLYHDATCNEPFCRLCGEGIREWETRRY